MQDINEQRDTFRRKKMVAETKIHITTPKREILES